MLDGRTPEDARPRVLCVDDEPRILTGLQRVLGREYEVRTAQNADEGLTAIELDGPFAAVVSDLYMPEMVGIGFLEQVRRIAPQTSRVLLTGNADLDVAIDAVNRGSVYRFLTKPYDPPVLLAALAAAVEHNRLLTLERELLEQTLHGSIKVMLDILTRVRPQAFGRALRTKELVRDIAAHAGAGFRWEAEVAAMLAQIGSVTLEPGLAHKIYRGDILSPAESEQAARLPRIAAELIARIPRLEGVREILLLQEVDLEYQNERGSDANAGGILWSARLLRLALDYDMLVTQGFTPRAALAELMGRRRRYERAHLAALRSLCQARQRPRSASAAAVRERPA